MKNISETNFLIKTLILSQMFFFLYFYEVYMNFFWYFQNYMNFFWHLCYISFFSIFSVLVLDRQDIT